MQERANLRYRTNVTVRIIQSLMLPKEKHKSSQYRPPTAPSIPREIYLFIPEVTLDQRFKCKSFIGERATGYYLGNGDVTQGRDGGQ